MFQTIRQKLRLINSYDDAIVWGDIPSRPAGLDLLNAKREEAKKYLGTKWIAHPANRVTKKMDDAANDERQALIARVK